MRYTVHINMIDSFENSLRHLFDYKNRVVSVFQMQQKKHHYISVSGIVYIKCIPPTNHRTVITCHY